MAAQVIDLPADLETFVKEAVSSGRFASANEVYCAALSSLRDKAADIPHGEDDLIEAINKGLDDLDAGRSTKFANNTAFIEWSDGVLTDIRKEKAAS